jgi:hypothetical protein
VGAVEGWVGPGLAVYGGIVWLHATATNRQGSNAIPLLNVLIVSSLGVTTRINVMEEISVEKV